MEQEIYQLINKLKAIARQNSDSFSFDIEPEIIAGKIRFTFGCYETADRHCFVGGSGFSFKEMVENVEKNLPEACKSWGYDMIGNLKKT